MRNIKLVLEYDGTDFYGWQWQPKGRTVQGTVQSALKQLLREKVKLIAAGRTDAGVHALGQVANFRTRSELSEETIRQGLNYYLPHDVVVVEAAEVEDAFHARYSAVKRTYRYKISTRPRAIGRQFFWRCPYELDVEKMREASACLRGEHVFTAFCKPNKEEPHYLCNVETAEWREEEDTVVFEITANRFLHHMVRILVGTLVDVGRGKLRPDEVQAILESGDRHRAGFVAPAAGLFLTKVHY